jgi:predicted acyltransferase
MQTTSNKPSRLLSLDILRGIDIFMLVGGHFILRGLTNLGAFGKGEFADAMRRQLAHVPWEGFVAWDLVMPLFLFMAGIALPFSLAKYQTSTKTYLRILRRVVLLWILGMVVQGRLLSLDPKKISLYSNTLQAIAAGYLVTALIFINIKNNRWRVFVAVLLFVVYWAGFTFFGDFTPTGNFAEAIDRAVLGRWRDGVTWKDGVWSFSPKYHYTWIWSSIGFALTTLAGAFSGLMLKGEACAKKALHLFLFGDALVVAGLLLSLQTPIIKPIWSASMVLYSGGICAVLMTLTYWYIDVKGKGKWLYWFKIYGMNSIFAYVVSHVISFRSVSESLFFGFARFLEKPGYDFLLGVSNAAILFVMLVMLYRKKIFIRV